MHKPKKHTIARVSIYAGGLLLLALGITLNSLTGLGASAIVSVPFTISQTTSWNFGNLTLLVYCLFVAAQFFISDKSRGWLILLQIPLSIIFTRFMNLFKDIIPYHSGSFPADLLVLAAAILFTGIGAAMTVTMNLIPNPGDGIVASISIRSQKELGLCKNLFDIGCFCCSLLIGTAFGTPLAGVGLGTLLSMIGVGRVISGFNYLFRKRLLSLSGLV